MSGSNVSEGDEAVLAAYNMFKHVVSQEDLNSDCIGREDPHRTEETTQCSSFQLGSPREKFIEPVNHQPDGEIGAQQNGFECAPDIAQVPG